MSWIWWIISTVGIGGALLIGAILIFGWPVIAGTRLGRMLVAIGAGVLAVMAVLAKVRAGGVASEKERQQKERAKIDRQIDEVEDAAEARTAEENRERLKKWGKKNA